MGKPRMIILIRHAQSEGNKNREIHQRIPDHRVQLTPEGWSQAHEAGRKLRTLLRPEDTLHFFTSPYRRTRETTEGILNTLSSSDPAPSPFPRNAIKVYEEPRLREQDFGNFQPDAAEMSRMWQERADYGHFFYRIPNGESAADAYDRVSGFNESLWRSFGEDTFASVCVLVTHGLMSRVFLMKWYHFSVEYFEDLRNVNHCEFIVMKLNQDSGKYVLQNQLRTWSELRRERLNPKAPLEQEKPVPVRTKWGGSQNSNDDNTDEQFILRQQKRRNTADLFMDEQLEARINEANRRNEALQSSRSPLKEQLTQPPEGSPSPAESPNSATTTTGTTDPKKPTNGSPSKPSKASASKLVRLAVHKPGESTSETVRPRTPVSQEYTEADDKERMRMLPMRNSLARALRGELDVDYDGDERPRADALGDQSDAEDDGDVDTMQKAELSVDGIVR